jgi:hypothetical protein
MNVQVVDSLWWKPTSVATGWAQADRLRGKNYLSSQSTAAEISNTNIGFDGPQYSSPPAQTVYLTSLTGASDNQALYAFRRAPGFFDGVCYTGLTGDVFGQYSHNLQAPPQLVLIKSRSATENWGAWCANNGVPGGANVAITGLSLNSTAAASSTSQVVASQGETYFTPGAVTGASGSPSDFDQSGKTYVAYLFASAPGVSKVGSYTGTGATQVIDCGFTGGARFVLIKATSTTGDWYVWDSARGIVAGNDPYIRLNSGAAEVTNTDWVDTAASGFELSNAGGNLANSNGVSYIFLAIA